MSRFTWLILYLVLAANLGISVSSYDDLIEFEYSQRSLAPDSPLDVQCTLFRQPNSRSKDRVTEIYISRGPVKVATLTVDRGPQKLENNENLAVNGQFFNEGRKQGSLTLTWMHPFSTKTEHFKCVVVMMSGNVMKSKDKNLHVSWGGQKNSSGQLEFWPDEDVGYKISEVESLRSRVATMREFLNSPPKAHVEFGVQTCEKNMINKYVSFQKAYHLSPVVILTAHTMHFDTTKNNFRFRFYVDSVMKSGFNLTCRTWYHTTMYKARISWTSIGH